MASITTPVSMIITVLVLEVGSNTLIVLDLTPFHPKDMYVVFVIFPVIGFKFVLRKRSMLMIIIIIHVK